MHIVLLILKIIGAILGGLVGLLLFLVLLLLFVPIRYQFHIWKKDDLNVNSCVSWLFHIVHVSILFEQNEMKYCFRIFGIPLKQNIEERKHKKHQKEKANKKKSKKRVKKKKTTQTQKKKEAEETKLITKSTQVPMKHVKKEENGKEEIPVHEESHMENGQEDLQIKEVKPTRRKFHPFRKLKELYETLKRKISDIKLKWSHLKSQLRKVLDKKNKVFAVLKKEGTKNSFRKAKKALLELIVYIGPRKLRGYIKFGTGDPCQTGQILGIISIVRAYYDLKVSVYPEFEEKLLEVDLKAHGRMRIVRFLRLGGGLYFDKEIKEFIADVKQLKEE